MKLSFTLYAIKDKATGQWVEEAANSFDWLTMDQPYYFTTKEQADHEVEHYKKYCSKECEAVPFQITEV